MLTRKHPNLGTTAEANFIVFFLNSLLGGLDDCWTRGIVDGGILLVCLLEHLLINGEFDSVGLGTGAQVVHSGLESLLEEKETI